MPIGGTLKEHFDIVMCIDATANMAPIIAEVKNNAKTFYQKLVEKKCAVKVEPFKN